MKLYNLLVPINFQHFWRKSQENCDGLLIGINVIIFESGKESIRLTCYKIAVSLTSLHFLETETPLKYSIKFETTKTGCLMENKTSRQETFFQWKEQKYSVNLKTLKISSVCFKLLWYIWYLTGLHHKSPKFKLNLNKILTSSDDLDTFHNHMPSIVKTYVGSCPPKITSFSPPCRSRSQLKRKTLDLRAKIVKRGFSLYSSSKTILFCLLYKCLEFCSKMSLIQRKVITQIQYCQPVIVLHIIASGYCNHAFS